MIWTVWVVLDGGWTKHREGMSWGDGKAMVTALGKQGVRAACCRDGAIPTAMERGDVRPIDAALAAGRKP